jgi:hypothetical protein
VPTRRRPSPAASRANVEALTDRVVVERHVESPARTQEHPGVPSSRPLSSLSSGRCATRRGRVSSRIADRSRCGKTSPTCGRAWADGHAATERSHVRSRAHKSPRGCPNGCPTCRFAGPSLRFPDVRGVCRNTARILVPVKDSARSRGRGTHRTWRCGFGDRNAVARSATRRHGPDTGITVRLVGPNARAMRPDRPHPSTNLAQQCVSPRSGSVAVDAIRTGQDPSGCAAGPTGSAAWPSRRDGQGGLGPPRDVSGAPGHPWPVWAGRRVKRAAGQPSAARAAPCRSG